MSENASGIFRSVKFLAPIITYSFHLFKKTCIEINDIKSAFFNLWVSYTPVYARKHNICSGLSNTINILCKQLVRP